MPESRYDMIICGAGMAGLSLLYRAMKSELWLNQRVLVVDQSAKDKNDKTWSFWKKGVMEFDDIISTQWKDLSFFSAAGQKIVLQPAGYTYNSIKSIDFYTQVLEYLKGFNNITFVQEAILSFSSGKDECTLFTESHTYTCTYLFNSIYQLPQLAKDTQYFLQHFKGWKIKTNAVMPKLSEAYLMDFRTDQKRGTTFFYTLPLSSNELFIEYTLFTKTVLDAAEYDKQIAIYLQEVLHIEEYEVLEREAGVIPMTDYQFARFEGNIINIGTAGGDTRGSTGYTFTNTQKTISRILDSMRRDGHPFFKEETISTRHQLYDTTLLNVLDKGNYTGHQLFTDLFEKCPAPYIFAFLDAETSLFQDLQIMKSLRVMPFLKSFMGAVYRRFL